ncbi:MAG: hypothetical protein C0183_21530 [Roseiflexus castenholzii]|uniref:hypothetical protein n=1 Tax=Roseiflexus castenholzii TaxID=120962 RepID=UPI000CB644A5|nr:MAG: hypothetical protein C0183_21530 [Roseiflexus castenholzii]
MPGLRGLPNVYFDTSAVTEAGAFEAIVETLVLYGADFPIGHMRGRCVAIGDSFRRFYAEDMRLDERHTTLRPALSGIESLRSLKLTAWHPPSAPAAMQSAAARSAARGAQRGVDERAVTTMMTT